MPKPSVWMIRVSFVYLAVVTVSGALILANKGSVLHPAIWALLPMHYELAIWGWLVQFVMGTAYWIFPRYLKGKPRGPETLAWLVAALLNTGILFIILGSYISDGQLYSAAGRIFTATSILIFILIMAGRVVSYRNVHNHETEEV